jgi:transcriptional regulator with XRE-family HTH domain
MLRGERKPSPETLETIAHALRLPTETVYQAAGILPPDPASDPLTEEILYIARQLPEADVQELIELARLKLNRHERTQNAARKP